MEEKFSFEELKVYQKALEYVDFVYTITRDFPKAEAFSLTDQFRRAAVSICLNIAEGTGGSQAEFNQFLKNFPAFSTGMCRCNRDSIQAAFYKQSKQRTLKELVC
jgi:hypothetical protein